MHDAWVGSYAGGRHISEVWPQLPSLPADTERPSANGGWAEALSQLL